MQNPTKPGGGNKPQPYVPAGHGDESGEYTNKESVNCEIKQKQGIKHCHIKNVRFHYNFLGSKLVKKVTNTFISDKGVSIKKIGHPNSVSKKIIGGYVVTERYYNNKGEAYLDIDYTCHGNPAVHPFVPHIHRWTYIDGKLQRGGWEKFQWNQNV